MLTLGVMVASGLSASQLWASDPVASEAPAEDAREDATANGSSEASESPPRAAAWFQLHPRVAEQWQMKEGGSPSALQLVPKGSAEPETRALVLFSKSSSAYDTAMNRILTVFGHKGLEVSWTLYNTWQRPASARRELRKIQAGAYDIVFAMGSASTESLYRRLFGDATPVVTVCAKDPVLMGWVDDYEGGSGANFAFTSLNVPVEIQLAYLRQLKPELSQIAVVYARDNTSAVRTQVEPMVEKAAEEAIELHRVTVVDRSNARAELDWKVARAVYRMKQRDPEGARSLFWITGSTSVFENMATILQHTGKIPVLAVTPSLVTSGEDSALLSIGAGFESNAQLAALYGVQILEGAAQPGELDVGVVLPPDISINFRKARELGLKIPFEFFESASVIFDTQGRLVRHGG